MKTYIIHTQDQAFFSVLIKKFSGKFYQTQLRSRMDSADIDVHIVTSPGRKRYIVRSLLINRDAANNLLNQNPYYP